MRPVDELVVVVLVPLLAPVPVLFVPFSSDEEPPWLVEFEVMLGLVLGILLVTVLLELEPVVVSY